MSKYLIIYHREDNDGVISGGLFYNYLVNSLGINPVNIDMLPSDYNFLKNYQNEHTPEDLHKKYTNIIITDVSFNDANYMKALYDEFGTDMAWVDHHKPIIDASYKFGYSICPGIRDMSRSAILNTWKYLYDPFDEAYNKEKSSLDSVPELLRILSAYDSWSYENEGYSLDYVRNVNTGFTEKFKLNLPDVLNVIENLIDLYINKNLKSSDNIINDCYYYGKQINDYEESKMKRILDEEGDKTWKIITDNKEYTDSLGHWGPSYRPACAIFYQGPTNSQMFKSVRKDCANGIVFKHQVNGNWNVSLYNTDNDKEYWDNSKFHCGDYLKEKYGGGGHAGAAGCVITQEQFIEILKKKEL